MRYENPNIKYLIFNENKEFFFNFTQYYPSSYCKLGNTQNCLNCLNSNIISIVILHFPCCCSVHLDGTMTEL